MINRFLISAIALLLSACTTPPPRDVNNLCHIVKEYPRWLVDARDAERRWHVPVPVQMAIIHQESKFDSRAKPGRRKIFWVIPWARISSAYGYAQALNGTWALYKHSEGGMWVSRNDFTDAVDFIGWYANLANQRAGISRQDAYALYLAYHEGIGGYQRKTYLAKPWLIQVARKVKARSEIFKAQLQQCH